MESHMTAAAVGGSPNKASPSAALSQKENWRDRSTETNTVKFTTMVHVSGYPPYTQMHDLKRVFAKFGNAKVTYINPKFAFLTFFDKTEAEAAIQASQKLNIYGKFLTIQPRSGDQAESEITRHKQQTLKKEFPKSKQKAMEIIDPKNIDLSGDFFNQMHKVQAAVCLTVEDVKKLDLLYKDLQNALQEAWPGCIAIPFGSIPTGLGIKTSDVDCFIKVSPEYGGQNANHVLKAKRILQYYPQIFSEVLSIPGANTPIVKFFHVPTSTNCDVTFKTLLGVQNSKLITFLLHSDPRLIPISVFIKYWAKCHDLSGTGKLTNYALTMLIVFYLQQTNLSILPPIEKLQRDASHDFIVDFWNTGFNNDPNAFPKVTNQTSLADLLGGFFEFYSEFDFEQMVVCPYLGYPIKKDHFRDLNLLPGQFSRYKHNITNSSVMPLRFTTPICIQDPFEQCHNVASCITSRLAAEIKVFFKFAMHAYQQDKGHNFSKFVKIILLQRPQVTSKKGNPEFRVNLFSKLMINITDPKWQIVIKQNVFTIFEKMLFIKLNVIQEKTNVHLKKIKEKFSGILMKRIWKRKQYTKLHGAVKQELQDKEASISKEIINNDKEPLELHFILTIIYLTEPHNARIIIKFVKGDLDSFREFGKFIVGSVSQWFHCLLKQDLQSEEKLSLSECDTSEYLKASNSTGNSDSRASEHTISDPDDSDSDDKVDYVHTGFFCSRQQ